MKRAAHSRSGPFRRVIVGVVIASVCVVGQPDEVQAVDNTRRKAALSLLEVAKFYYQSGKFLKAAQGFHEAYAIDPRPEFLFNGARAEHLGMDLDNAAKHYRECIALKTSNAKLNKRSKLYLSQVEATLVALEKARAEGAKTAQRRAAKAQAAVRRSSGTTEARLEGVDRIKATGPSTSGAAKAQGTASEPPPKKSERATTPAASASIPGTSQADASIAHKTPSGSWRTPVGWGGVGLGTVGLALAVKMMLDYSAGQADLDALVAKKDSAGAIVGIGSAAYMVKQNELNSTGSTAVVSAIVGTAMLGAGAYVLLTAPVARTATLAPWTTGRGLNVSVRF